jgi:hypothetical protein
MCACHSRPVLSPSAPPQLRNRLLHHGEAQEAYALPRKLRLSTNSDAGELRELNLKSWDGEQGKSPTTPPPAMMLR